MCDWLEACDTHLIHAPMLFRKIRIMLFSAEQLYQLVEGTEDQKGRPYLKNDIKCYKIYLEAYKNHSLKIPHTHVNRKLNPSFSIYEEEIYFKDIEIRGVPGSDKYLKHKHKLTSALGPQNYENMESQRGSSTNRSSNQSLSASEIDLRRTSQTFNQTVYQADSWQSLETFNQPKLEPSKDQILIFGGYNKLDKSSVGVIKYDEALNKWSDHWGFLEGGLCGRARIYLLLGTTRKYFY